MCVHDANASGVHNALPQSVSHHNSGFYAQGVGRLWRTVEQISTVRHMSAQKLCLSLGHHMDTITSCLPHQLLRHIVVAEATPMAVASPSLREMHGGHVLQNDYRV